MRYSLRLLPLDPRSSLCEIAVAVRTELDQAGLRYDTLESTTIVDACWNELVPVLNRVDAALQGRPARVGIVLSQTVIASTVSRYS